MVLVQVFLPSDPMQYLDESVDITPATTYEYRVMVQTGAGQGFGPWAEVTTRSSSEYVQGHGLCVCTDVHTDSVI